MFKNTLNLFLLLSIFIITINTIVVQSKNEDSFNIYQHLSTKTPYWIPDGNINNNSTPDPPSGCKLGHIEFLARHGSRNPVRSNIATLEELASTLLPYASNINNEFQWILNWTVPYPTSTAGLLILQGQYEHYNISKRFLERFNGYFQPYQPYIYEVSATYVSRTGISATAFMYGLFENDGALGPQNFQPVFIDMQSADQDYLLRFFDTCNSYTELLASGVINNQEKVKYNNMTFPNITLDISTKLGLQEIWEPTNSIVSAMFSACSYDISILGITDHWCSLFSEQDILQWEYAEDLSNYWMKSYGHEENYIISSLLFQDMINGIELFINDTDAYNATNVLRFAHAETILPFISLLGLYKDDYPLLANLTQEQIENRKWRSSVISPYAANVALLLYECDGGDYKIRVDHNEVGIQIPGCDDLYCDYNQFKSLFTEALAFNWTTYCNVNSGGNSDNGKNNGDNSHNDHELKILLGIFIPLSAIVGLIIGVVITKFYLSSNSRIIYSKISGDGAQY